MTGKPLGELMNRSKNTGTKMAVKLGPYLVIKPPPDFLGKRYMGGRRWSIARLEGHFGCTHRPSIDQVDQLGSLCLGRFHPAGLRRNGVQT